MSKHTTRELATNRDLWEEYIDPDNAAPTAFDDMSTAEKMEAIVEMFPQDVNDDDEEGLRILNTHGGPRPGSGRPPNEIPSQRVVIHATPDELETILRLTPRERTERMLEGANDGHVTSSGH